MTDRVRFLFCLSCLVGLMASPTLVVAQNDDCADRIPITDGDTGYTTIGATTDGPANCAGSFGSDIWFNYTATCDGDLTLSTCDQVDYDSAIAVYSGTDCPVGTGASVLLGCNDDGPGCASFSSLLIVAVFMHMVWERLAIVYAILVPPVLVMVFVAIMVVESDYTFDVLPTSCAR